jgi:hypothetical protein
VAQQAHSSWQFLVGCHLRPALSFAVPKEKGQQHLEASDGCFGRARPGGLGDHGLSLDQPEQGRRSLLLEIVPADKPGCAPAQPPRPASSYDDWHCTGANESDPAVGSHVTVPGAYVYDEDHGWSEIHPVWAISASSGVAATPPPTPTRVIPTPTTNAAHDTWACCSDRRDHRPGVFAGGRRGARQPGGPHFAGGRMPSVRHAAQRATEPIVRSGASHSGRLGSSGLEVADRHHHAARHGHRQGHLWVRLHDRHLPDIGLARFRTSVSLRRSSGWRSHSPGSDCRRHDAPHAVGSRS